MDALEAGSVAALPLMPLCAPLEPPPPPPPGTQFRKCGGRGVRSASPGRGRKLRPHPWSISLGVGCSPAAWDRSSHSPLLPRPWSLLEAANGKI